MIGAVAEKLGIIETMALIFRIGQPTGIEVTTTFGRQADWFGYMLLVDVKGTIEGTTKQSKTGNYCRL